MIRFRERVHQAASMLRQHRRFLEIHERDDFVREYMEAIGRHEFGKGLKPVDFGGWMGEARFPDELALWVRYWVAGYWFVLEQAGEDVVLVSYARLTEEPGAALERLAEALDLSTPELTSLAGPLRPPRTHDAPTAAVADSVLDQADRTHERLRRRADV